MTFGSRLFQLQVQISFIVFTMDPSYFSGRHLLTVHLLSRYTSGTNLCLLVLKVAHKKNKKPVTSLDELNELKWTNPNYNWNIFYMYKIGLTADKRRQAYKGKFRSVWRNWWNYNVRAWFVVQLQRRLTHQSSIGSSCLPCIESARTWGGCCCV